MSWLDRISTVPAKENPHSHGAGMEPGLGGPYDQDLREKAGLHTPPPPPEFMGLEGEYDPSGLVKRVAIALDETPDIPDISSLTLVQRGATIQLEGQIADQHLLDRITQIVSQVDGTKALDINNVMVG